MYKQINPNVVQRIRDGAFIPADPANTDYEEYLAWVAAGNVATPLPAPDPNATIQAKIDAIETATMVPRVMREFLLASAERAASEDATKATAAGTPTTAEELLAKNIGYVKAKQLDDQIKQLRSQLA